MIVIYEDPQYEMPDGTIWHLTVFDTMVLDLDGQIVNCHSMVRVPNAEELAQAEVDKVKQERISYLKETIGNKKLLDMDCTIEQTELRDLLGL